MSSGQETKIDIHETKKEVIKTPTVATVDLTFRDFLLEFLGNFFLVNAIYLSGGSPVLPPATVALLVTLIGPVSGAHFNLAITVLIPIIERHHGYPRSTLKRCVGYFIAQFLGSVAANVLNCLLIGWDKLLKVSPGEHMTVYSAVGLEFFLTSALILYACAVCHPNAQRESYLNGFAFFVFIFTVATSAGQHSGALINPTLSLAFGMMNLVVKQDVNNFVIMLAYTAVQVISAPVGFLIYKFFLSDAMFPQGEVPSLKDEQVGLNSSLLVIEKDENLN